MYSATNNIFSCIFYIFTCSTLRQHVGPCLCSIHQHAGHTLFAHRSYLSSHDIIGRGLFLFFFLQIKDKFKKLARIGRSQCPYTGESASTCPQIGMATCVYIYTRREVSLKKIYPSAYLHSLAGIESYTYSYLRC